MENALGAIREKTPFDSLTHGGSALLTSGWKLVRQVLERSADIKPSPSPEPVLTDTE